MADRIKSLLARCSKMDFGPLVLTRERKEFCSNLNNEVLSLCKSLPGPAQSGALFFLMWYFQIPFSGKFSIFMKYYAPAWSIVYWLLHSVIGRHQLNQKVLDSAMTAHSMALLLHPFDDHLSDGQVPASHLTLLLRSQAWMIMNHAFDSLLGEIGESSEVVNDLLDRYYAGIESSENANCLDDYCELFRKQMATWLIVPTLLAIRIQAGPKVVADIQSAYESFGIAWRLLDDINDIQSDMMQGSKSSIYACLPADIKGYWEKEPEDDNSKNSQVILKYVLKNRVVDIVKARICRELESAASAADNFSLPGWGDEIRCLLKPLKI